MRLAKPLIDRQVEGFRRAPGPEPKLFMGFPVVLLTTIGAKTGKEHTHVLGGFPDGTDAWLVVASKGGAATHPAGSVIALNGRNAAHAVLDDLKTRR